MPSPGCLDNGFDIVKFWLPAENGTRLLRGCDQGIWISWSTICNLQRDRMSRHLAGCFNDLMGQGFELTSEYKDGIFYIRNTIDYTKIDFKKLKEIVPGFNPLDDKTVSYSVTKDSLIKGGMVEK